MKHILLFIIPIAYLLIMVQSAIHIKLQAYKRNLSPNAWVLGFILPVISNLIILFIPYSQKYIDEVKNNSDENRFLID